MEESWRVEDPSRSGFGYGLSPRLKDLDRTTVGIAVAHHYARAGELHRQGLHRRFPIVEACGERCTYISGQPDIAEHDRAFAAIDPGLMDGGIEVHVEIHRKGHEL